MTLTPGQWAAIDALVATHCPNPKLVQAVENELERVREINMCESETIAKQDKVDTTQNGPGGAINTVTRGLTTTMKESQL